MPKPRLLRGHQAAATSCVSSRDRPGLVVTSAEDGCICWFDLRCKDSLSIMDIGLNNPISSLCFKPGNEDVMCVSFGNEVKCFDVHMAATWKPLESYSYNKEEINQIACDARSLFLGAADDGGDVKIIDIRQKCLYKTLRACHSSICSSVQFVPWRPWEVITGGLDSKLVIWDFSKGRPINVMDFGAAGLQNKDSMGQFLNPAFIHCIALPEADMVDRLGKICIVAKGDGVINVVDVESELANMKSSSSKPRKGSQIHAKRNAPSSETASQDQNGRNMLHLDHSFKGHTAAVSCVAFSMFGEKGRLMISGGNDKFVKVWDMSKCIGTDQRNSDVDLLHLNINLSRKVNWLCSTPTDAENLVICDTSKVVKVYTVA